MYQVFAGWTVCTPQQQAVQVIGMIFLLAVVIIIFRKAYKITQRYNSKHRGVVYDLVYIITGFFIACFLSFYVAMAVFSAMPWCS